MSLVARGHVRDRPFARTVYAIAARRFSGDFAVAQGQQRYTVTWRDGWIVAAASPSPADTPGRLALTSGLVTSTQLAEAVVQADRGDALGPLDVLDVLAPMAGLSPEQVLWVRRRTLAHCATRVFSLGDGAFSLDDQPSLEPHPDVAAVHACWVIYHGLRQFYDEERLAAELAALGQSRFRLSEQGAARLGDFGLDDDAARCARAFATRQVTLSALVEAAGMPRPAVMALVYALLASDCLEVARSAQGAPRAAQGVVPAAAPVAAPGPRAHGSAQGAAPAARARGSAQGAAPAAAPASRSSQGAGQGIGQGAGQGIGQGAGRTAPPGARSPGSGQGAGQHAGRTAAPAPASSAAARAARERIRAKLQELDAGADHFRVLGVPRGAAEAQVRQAYFALARWLHPDQLRRHGITGRDPGAQRVMAQVNLAFGVLSHPSKRAVYEAELDAAAKLAASGGGADAEAQAARVLGAERRFRLGEMALRRGDMAQALEEFRAAVELNPDEAEHHAMLGWAAWCAADDKPRALPVAQDALRKALSLSPLSPTVFFYRGRIASQSGQVDQAIESFRRVLELDPDHKEAALELRVLEARRDEKKGGLLGRFKRKP